jgi:phosphatidylserine decarboxylase
MSKDQIVIYNRAGKCLQYEDVYGRKWIDLFYGAAWGRQITRWMLIRRPLSVLYGRLQQHPVTRRQIASFIEQFDIDMTEVQVPPDGFHAFNDFFIRRLKPGARPIAADPDCLIAPADSRLQVFTLDNTTPVHVKGTGVTLPQLLGEKRLAAGFEGGLCLCFRLAPCDYHRFAYPDDGIQGRVHIVPGALHSVNPLSLKHKPDILGTNYRHWCFVEGMHFDTMIYIEVGALLVGSIVQYRPQGGRCLRGAEKGYFQFGGSTVLILLKPGRAVMDPDIASYSNKGIETLVRLGERIGHRPA